MRVRNSLSYPSIHLANQVVHTKCDVLISLERFQYRTFKLPNQVHIIGGLASEY